MQLGPFLLENRLFVAPMAGVTDRAFRQICRQFGAGYAVSEMVTSRRNLWHSPKTLRRANHIDESSPIAVQITGVDPVEMADAALHNIDCGAQIIDINMGCPAKKVCKKWAGSALMQNETAAMQIIDAVVSVCSTRNVPVTLKMRTGWSEEHRNAVQLARLAANAGIAMLTVHGRTREQGYKGSAEYETIAAVKAAVHIPVVANGDIDSPQKAAHVLSITASDALMLGRAVMGQPWLFREINHYLQTGQLLPKPTVLEVRATVQQHLQSHYSLYGEHIGVRSVRKHIGWYVSDLPGGQLLRQKINRMESANAQMQAVDIFFANLQETSARLPETGLSARQTHECLLAA